MLAHEITKRMVELKWFKGVTETTNTDESFVLRYALLGMAKENYCVAVDFDGTLCSNNYPKIGNPLDKTIEEVKLLQGCGVKTILWTCRSGKRLEEAVDWCRSKGLVFTTVNENLPERIEKWKVDSRKISAEEYWDDRAVEIETKKKSLAILPQKF